jgi:hypothetical protein
MRCALALGAVVLSSAFVPAAHAAAGEAQLIAAGSMLGGKQSWGADLNVSGAGKLTVQAYDLGVRSTIVDRLDSLSFSVSNSTSMFGSHVGSGEFAMDISGPGMYFLSLQATPSLQSRFQLGLVSWRVTFEPNVSAVPLPASVWLLIAGLAWATGMQRRRAKLGCAGPEYRNQSVTYAT